MNEITSVRSKRILHESDVSSHAANCTEKNLLSGLLDFIYKCSFKNGVRSHNNEQMTIMQDCHGTMQLVVMQIWTS
ncbi:hypothetical protein ACJX0J_026986, partial [Zea mays]